MKYSIYKRENGNYYLKIVDRNKTILRITTGTKRKNEALQFLKEYQFNISKSVDKNITFKDAATLFKEFRKDYVVKRYYKQIEKSLERLQNFAKNKYLFEINKQQIERFLLNLTDSNHFRNLNYRIIRAFFNWCIDAEYLLTNPCKKIKLPKIPQKENLFISIDHLKKIMEVEESQIFRDIYSFAFYSGMRLNEIINCKLNWIDLENSFITIKNDNSFTTKSKQVRQIPINAKLNEIISRNFPKIRSINQDEFLFNFPIVDKKQYISKRFKDAVKIVFGNDSKIHFHNLRGSYGSELIKRGANLYTVSKLLGHYSVSVTEKFYIAIQQDELRKTANLLD